MLWKKALAGRDVSTLPSDLATSLKVWSKIKLAIKILRFCDSFCQDGRIGVQVLKKYLQLEKVCHFPETSKII